LNPSKTIQDQNVRLKAGQKAFQEDRYWDAHEDWESVWLHLHGAQKTHLQAWIQIAALFYHLQRGSLRPAIALAEAALLKIKKLGAEIPFEAGGTPMSVEWILPREGVEVQLEAFLIEVKKIRARALMLGALKKGKLNLEKRDSMIRPLLTTSIVFKQFLADNK
jgi:hypothetical protein